LEWERVEQFFADQHGAEAHDVLTPDSEKVRDELTEVLPCTLSPDCKKIGPMFGIPSPAGIKTSYNM
jgi:hypothetical protein